MTIKRGLQHLANEYEHNVIAIKIGKLKPSFFLLVAQTINHCYCFEIATQNSPKMNFSNFVAIFSN